MNIFIGALAPLIVGGLAAGKTSDPLADSLRVNQEMVYVQAQVQGPNKLELGSVEGVASLFAGLISPEQANKVDFTFEAGKPYCLIAGVVDQSCDPNVTIEGAASSEISRWNGHFILFTPSAGGKRVCTVSVKKSCACTLGFYLVGGENHPTGDNLRAFADHLESVDKDAADLGLKPLPIKGGWSFMGALLNAGVDCTVGGDFANGRDVKNVRAVCFADDVSEHYALGGTDGGADLPIDNYAGRFVDHAHSGGYIEHDFPYPETGVSLGMGNVKGGKSLIGLALFGKP
jgi:hypothetical protein